MENHYDVIVLGVGSMGAATCWALSRRGLKVLGLERYSVPHRMGSHHGETRMIRQAYFEHPDYVRLLHHAYAAWLEIIKSNMTVDAELQSKSPPTPDDDCVYICDTSLPLKVLFISKQIFQTLIRLWLKTS